LIKVEIEIAFSSLDVFAGLRPSRV